MLRPQGTGHSGPSAGTGRGAWERSRGLWGEAVDGSIGLEATVGHNPEGHPGGSGVQIDASEYGVWKGVAGEAGDSF